MNKESKFGIVFVFVFVFVLTCMRMKCETYEPQDMHRVMKKLVHRNTKVKLEVISERQDEKDDQDEYPMINWNIEKYYLAKSGLWT